MKVAIQALDLVAIQATYIMVLKSHFFIASEATHVYMSRKATLNLAM